MNKVATLILATVVCGCSYSSGNLQSSKTPEVDHSKDPAWQSQQEDTNWVVSPGWHDGKEFPLTQSLKANPVKKEKLDDRQDDRNSN